MLTEKRARAVDKSTNVPPFPNPTSILENLQMWEGSVHGPEAVTGNGEKTLGRQRAVANRGPGWVWGRQHAAVSSVGPEQGDVLEV